MEPEPEAADDVKQSAGAKINGKINAVLKEHSETSPLGLSGPTLRGQLLKQSAHIKEWRDRFFVLKERKIFYFSSEEDSKPDADGKTWHKGYIDLVGCTVEAFEDSGSDLSVYYGFLVTEEAPHPTDPTPPLRLCSAHEHQRDEWIETIKMASRPTWIDNKDPRAAVCMVSGVKFGLKTRKSHCRRSGGVMCKAETVLMELPNMGYTEPQKCCTLCQQGYVNKEPRAARSNVKPKAMDAAADAGKKAFGAAAGFFKSKKKDKK